jgi:cephalosporin hydroxylase
VATSWKQQAAGLPDRAVARAFSSVVRRQARHGSFSPAVLAAMQQSARRIERRRAEKPLTPAAERRLRRDLDRLQVVEGKRGRMKSPAVRGVMDAFHRLYYHDHTTWRRTKWRGITTYKCPLDLWMYQEMIHDLRPGLIVETGTAYGGSANYLAFICDLVGTGRIVTVDISPKTEDLPEHPRVTYLRGSSTDPAIVEQVHQMRVPDQPVIVILDSDHSEGHVRNEMLAYADLVTPGSYLVVEDTNVNGHPAYPEFGPGPMEAVNWFLTQRDDFVIDHSKERYHLTQNPRGFLKRREPAAAE